jgi:hypothetical protein
VASHYGLDNTSLEFDELRIASQPNLESGVAFTLERLATAEAVPSRMRRIAMGARNPTSRQWLGGRVGATMRE